jgi:GNAT superfamily N-acetyltransferase
MPVVDEKVYYLQMLTHARRALAAPRDGLTVIHAKKPTLAYYRFLYEAVGKAYRWYSRGKLSDAQLADILHNPLNEVHVLHVAGTPAGFAELDRRNPDDVELVQFGLMPDFIGQGLGKYFLQWTIDEVWSYSPKRFWLHTCSFDHPAALPTYLKAGFTVFKDVDKKREL